MPYKRRTYTRSARPSAPHQTVINANIAAATAAFTTGLFTCVPANADQGVRTVSRLNVKLATDRIAEGVDGSNVIYGYTIQYVPSGSNAQTPTWSATGDLVAANQFIMASGIWAPYQRIQDIYTGARKLYDGDALVMTLTNLEQVDVASEIHGLVTYYLAQ